MTTSLLSRLSASVDCAVGAEAGGLALARFGIGLAQVGQIRDATEILGQLRRQYHDSTISSVSIQIVLLEGIIYYYSTRSSISIDRVRRSNALAKAVGLVDLEVESAVWLAHLGFNFDEYEILKEGLRVGFDGFHLLPDELCGRICLVVADANQYLGHRDVSVKWYTFSRIFARRAHDHAVIAGIEYNRLAMGLSRVRIESCIPLARTLEDCRHWLNELGSVQRLHIGLSVHALNELLLLCDSRVRELDNDFAGALKVLTQIRDEQASERCAMTTGMLELEMSWCQVMSGAFTESIVNQLPKLDEIAKYSLADQIVALKFLRDISGIVELSVDSEIFQAMSNHAIEYSMKENLALERSISIASNYTETVERTINSKIPVQ